MLNKVKKLDYSGDTSTPPNVYNMAKGEWHGIVGSAMTQKQEWQRITFLLIGLLTISILGNIYLSNKSSVIPYVIEVNSETGKTLVQRLNAKPYTPNEAAIKSRIAEFIQNIQMVSTDQIVIQNSLLKGYDMVTSKGWAQLTTYIQDKRKPFDMSGQKAITVENIVINKITADSYQVEWTEDSYNIGSQKEPVTIAYTATITIKIDPPKTEERLLKNPLGINVDEFHISQKYIAQ